MGGSLGHIGAFGQRSKRGKRKNLETRYWRFQEHPA